MTPQVEFSCLIRRMRVRTSASIFGLARLFGRERRRQNKRKPARCQATMVSGLTMTGTLLHAEQRRGAESKIFDPGFGVEGEEFFVNRLCKAARASTIGPSSWLFAQVRNPSQEKLD
jgi:hypothetical protein